MKLSRYIVVMIVVTIFFGCDKFGTDALDENPPHLLTEETLFIDYEGFQTGLNGLYSLVRDERRSYSGGDANRMGWAIGGTDIWVTNSRHRNPGPSRLNADFGDLINPQDDYISKLFSWLYGIVNTANTLIERAQNDDEVDWSGGNAGGEDNKKLVIAEARAIRAWAYRHLTFTWGDVPLTLEPASGATIKTDWSRTPIDQVREQIIEDLEFAELHIPVERSLNGRITKGAVQHYLCEMYLIMDNPEEAINWANRVINTPEYKLITERYGVKSNEPGVPFMDMFLESNQNRSQGNSEALWVFQYTLNVVGGGVNHMRRHFGCRYGNIIIDGVSPLQFTEERGGRSATRSSLTNFALSLWEQGDDRGSHHAIRWFYILKNAEENAPFDADIPPSGYSFGDTIWTDYEENISLDNNKNVRRPYIRKLEAGADPIDITGAGAYGDWVYLRLGNTYLLKAEAQFALGDMEGAAETINIIRRRSNASEISPADVNIDFILDERSRELAVEEERKYTLLRTGKWIERTKAHNFRGGQFIEERHRLLPIPQDVIDSNLDGDLSQNPGY